MPNFGFWNLDKNVKPPEVAAFAHENDLDVLILAENANSNVSLQKAMNHNRERLYFTDSGVSDRLTIFTRFKTDLRVVFCATLQASQFDITNCLLARVSQLLPSTFPANSGKPPKDRHSVRRGSLIIFREAEQKVGHLRTLVIGDFNMNPFEHGLVGAEGFHSVMDRKVAVSRFRTIHEERRDYFYNPMWGFFGDRNNTPPGTYFYNSGGEICYYWNLFDQILVRPSLIPYMEDNSVEILTELSGYSLVNENGQPHREFYSDHLPVVCQMSEFVGENDGD